MTSTIAQEATTSRTGFAAITIASKTTAASVSGTSAATAAASTTSTTSTSTTSGKTVLILLIALPAILIVYSLVKRILKHRAAAAKAKPQPPAVYYLQAPPDPRFNGQWGKQPEVSMVQPWNGMYQQDPIIPTMPKAKYHGSNYR